MASGVYKILLGNGYIYYGSSKNLADRERQHRYTLSNGTHANLKMQHVYNKYGGFEFVILETCDEDKLLETEQGLLDEHFGKPLTINILPFAGRTSGAKRSLETRAKIADGNRGKIVSLETRKKIGDAHRGKIVSVETRKKIALAKQGIPRSAETIAKMVATRSARKVA